MRAGYAFVLAAAVLWGSLGVWFTILHDGGLGALPIGLLRAGIAGAILFIALLVREPRALRVSRRALVFYAGFGLVGIALFYVLYTEAVILTNIPTASVLLYSAPAWVTLVAWRAWGEPLTPRKLLALALAFGGVVLVARLYDAAQLSTNLAGIVVAICTGLTYALYTILSKIALERHDTITTVTYSLLFGALFLLASLWLPVPARSELMGAGLSPVLRDPRLAPAVLALCLGPTLGSYLFYNAGLRRVPASNASVIASLEPAVAALLGWLFLGQTLEAWQWLGAAMIVAGAAALSLEPAGQTVAVP